jgi:hypothetical protein
MLGRIAVVFMWAAGCSSGGQPTGISSLSCPPGSTLTYENFGEEAIASNCLSCHRSESPRLTSQAEIMAHANAIMEAAVYTDAMPEDADMPLAERQLLGEWLACGAP